MATNRLRFPLEFPVVTISMVVTVLAMFGPEQLLIVPLPYLLGAQVLLLWGAALVRKEWPRLKGMVIAAAVGAGVLALSVWLTSMLALQIASRIDPKATFSQSMEASQGYVGAGLVFFSLLGALGGTLFMWYWLDPQLPAPQTTPARG